VACQLKVVRTGSRYGLKALRTPLEHPQEHVTEVLDEVETVSYLDGTRCRFPDGVGLSLLRSRLTTSTPACRASHRENVSELRSGRISTSCL
jgi:hypothetical protein